MEKFKKIIPYILTLVLGMILYAGYMWVQAVQIRLHQVEVVSAIAANYLNDVSKGEFTQYLKAALETKQLPTQAPSTPPENTNQPTE